MQSHSFSDLGLSKPFLDAVASQGYTKPTEVQARAIPVLLSGANLLATAQTGTGKTAAFTLPLLQRLAADRRKGGAPSGGSATGRGPAKGQARPAALILAPTRELAIQIDSSLEEYGRGSGVSHLAIFGGAPKGRQLQGLRKNPAILAATPGRLLDFMGEREIDLSEVRYFILDEADRMLDMGFIPDVRRIAKAVTSREQTSLFSATMPPEIEALSRELLGKAERVAVAPKAVTADGIKQSVLHLAREAKIGLLPELIRERNMFRVLVFTRTKHRAKKVAKVLMKNGIPSDELHGNRTQNQRQRALESFRNGKVQVLVGTDVAARGIDVDDITHVINYEIPNEPETYVHRVGRTARAGSVGEAISLCDSEELSDFRQIEKMLKREVEVDRLHPYHKEPVSAGGTKGGHRPSSSQRRGGGHSRQGNPRRGKGPRRGRQSSNR